MTHVPIRTLLAQGTTAPVLIGAYLRRIATQIWLSILVVAICALLLCHADQWPAPDMGPYYPAIRA